MWQYTVSFANCFFVKCLLFYLNTITEGDDLPKVNCRMIID